MKKALVAVVLILAVGLGIFLYAYSGTDIPRLYLNGDITSMESKDESSDITFRYDDGTQEISGYAEIKYQGTSSMSYDKKNYTLKFYSDAEHDEKLKLDVGWGPQNKYCMKANWIDRTHARNVVSAKLAGRMQEKYGLLMESPNHGAVDGFPVEIYNNGKFYGLYTFNIPKDTWQFAMDEDDPNHIVVGGEGWEDANLFHDMPNFDAWEVEVGEDNDETLEKLNRLFDFVMNSSDAEFKENFSQYLNLDSALNYYVFSDLAYLDDNLGKNMLMATYDGMQWYLSLYDLDSSWGAGTNGWSLMEYEEGNLDLAKNNLFARMEVCFGQELAQRYFELRSGILSNENILAEFESFRDQIPEMTFLKETIKWGKGFIRKPEDLPGFDYDQIESYLNTVTARLDEKYSAMLK